MQKRIYQSLGGTRKDDAKIWEAFEAFGDRVGWRRGWEWLYYKELTFDPQAPVGHLPYMGGVGGRGVKGRRREGVRSS